MPAVCRILCSNVQGLAWNLRDLTVALSQYDILLWSETLVSDMSHVSELLFPVLVALTCCVGARCQDASGFRVCGVRQNLYGYSLYCNPDLYDQIF